MSEPEMSTPASTSSFAIMFDSPGTRSNMSPAITHSSATTDSSATAGSPGTTELSAITNSSVTRGFPDHTDLLDILSLRSIQVNIIPRGKYKPSSKPNKVTKSTAKPRSQHASRTAQSAEEYRINSRSFQDRIDAMYPPYLAKREQAIKMGLRCPPLIEQPGRQSNHGKARGPWRKAFLQSLEADLASIDQALGGSCSSLLVSGSELLAPAARVTMTSDGTGDMEMPIWTPMSSVTSANGQELEQNDMAMTQPHMEETPATFPEHSFAGGDHLQEETGQFLASLDNIQMIDPEILGDFTATQNPHDQEAVSSAGENLMFSHDLLASAVFDPGFLDYNLELDNGFLDDGFAFDLEAHQGTASGGMGA